MNKIEEEKTEITTKPKKKKKKLLKILGILVCAFILLFIIGFLYVSSSHFYRHVVFPMAGKKINRKLQADRINIKPLSHVELENFTITNPGKPKEPPLVKLGGLVMDYKGFSFLKGAPKIATISVSKPEANLVMYADGKTNVDDIMAAGKKPEKAPPKKEKKPSEPLVLPEFALNLLEVKNGSVNISQIDSQGNRVRKVSLENIGFKMTDLKPDQKSKMSVSMNFTMEDVPAKTKINRSSLSLKNEIFLAKDLSRIDVNGDFSLKDFQGDFQGNPMEGYEMEARLNLKKNKDDLELEPFSVVFRHEQKQAARFLAKGKYFQKKGEGKFTLEMDKIDRNLLNLVGSRAGNIDFRNTAISYKGDVAISDNNKKIESSGAFNIDKFSLLAPDISKQPTQEMDFSFVHKASLDSGKNTLQIPTLQIKAVQQGREVVKGDLDQPLLLNLAQVSQTAPAAPPIHYTFSVNKFDLTPFLLIAPLPEGTLITGADVNSNMKIDFTDNGKDINLKGNAALNGFQGKIMDFRIPETNGSLDMDINVADFSKIKIKKTEFLLSQREGTNNQGRVTGEVDISKGEGIVKLESLGFDLLTIKPFLPPELVSLKSGKITAQASVNIKEQFSRYNLESTANLSDFSCEVKTETEKFLIQTAFSSALNMSVNTAGEMKITGLDVEMKPKGQPAGKLEMIADMNLLRGSGNCSIKASDVNQRLFEPFVSPYLKDMTLVSLKIDTDQKIDMADKFQDIKINGETSLQNLKLLDKDKRDLVPPLELRLKNQLAYNDPRFDINQLVLFANPPGQKPETVNLKGNVIMNKKDATIKTAFNLGSDQITIDHFVPSFLFEEKKEAAPKRRRSETSPAPPQEELEPMDLGFLTLDGDVDIKKMIFKEVTFSDIIAKIKMENSVLDIPQLDMKVNNAECKTKMSSNFNVPGWKYAVDSNLNGMDIQPVVNSFVPRFKDEITGTAFMAIDINGQGTIPENLEKNLKGTIKGNLKDGKFSGLPILSSLANVTKISQLEIIRFFEGIVDLDISNGKININDLYFKGKVQKLGVKGWFGLDQTIDLQLYVALAAPLSSVLTKLKYLSDLVMDEDGYTELPVPVGMKGTFENPKPSFKITKVIEEKGKKVIKDLLFNQLKKQLD